MQDTSFRSKANGSPCGKLCPDRTPTCRPTCERFRQYDAERLQRDNNKSVYAGGSSLTDGQRKRAVRNVRYKKMHTQGRI